MTSLHDLRFNPPPNSKSRLCLRIKSCAIPCIYALNHYTVAFPIYFSTNAALYQSLHLSIVGAPSRAVAYNIAKVQSNKMYVALLPV